MDSEKIIQPFETKEHDLSGYASLDLYSRESFNTFAAKLADYNPDRFEPAALKIFAQELDIIVTLYAVDKSAQETGGYPEDKMPVRKFKLQMDWREFLRHIRYFSLVVSDGAYDISDLLVINK